MKNYFTSVWDGFFPARQPLPAMMLVFFMTAFCITQESLWAMIFYVGVGPFILYRLVRKPVVSMRDPLIILIGLLILWSALTLIWGENPGGHRVQKYGWGAVSTAFFITAIITLVRDHPVMRRRIGSVFIAAGTANAILSIVWYAAYMPDHWRLGGFAETSHPILGALIMGNVGLFALDRALREKQYRLANTVAVSIALLFILLTQSKGPICSILAAMTVLSCGISWRRGAALLVMLSASACVLVGTVTVLDHPLALEILHRLQERGTSYRLDIWSFTLQRVAERPWTGHGMAAYLGMKDFTFPHSLYLSTLFYSGIIGLGLFGAVIAVAGIRLGRQRANPATPLLLALLVNALCGGISDFGELTPGPTELWLVFWLPLALICAETQVQKLSAKST